MRLFIAIQLSDEMKHLVLDVEDTIRYMRVRGNYSPSENLHVTLAFIGEYNDPDAVLEVMEKVRFTPFSITMDRIGCFGDLWWTGFQENPELDTLAKNLRHALADAGIPMRDIPVGCAAGKMNGDIVLDLSEKEDKEGQADVPIVILPRTGEITLLQADGKLTEDEFEEALDLAMEGCMRISKIQEEALKERYNVNG